MCGLRARRRKRSVFALAYLLGIELQPRIRNWKHLVFYRPSKDARYKLWGGKTSAVVCRSS